MARPKSLAIYQDVILYTAPDSYVVGLDARTGRTPLADQGRRARPHVRTDCRQRQSDHGGNLRRRSARELLHRRARCAHGQGSLALLHHAGRQRSRRRFLERRSRRQARRIHVGAAWLLRSGAQPALLGHRESHAQHPRRSPRAAIPMAPRAPRRPISTATPPSRSIPIPASWFGTTSICPATTGTWTSTKSAR